MTAAEFREILDAAEWNQVELADYLVRHPRTVRRWLHGESSIPEVVARAVRNTPRLVAFDLWLQTVRGIGG